MIQVPTHQPVKRVTPPTFEMCADELWGGVRCTLRKGHDGSHQSRPTSPGGCSLTWRSSETFTSATP